MALHDHLESSVFAALQGVHVVQLVCDPPRFYVLLLLVSVLLVILVKAGIFDGDLHSKAGISDGDVDSASMYEKCAGDPNLGVGPNVEAYTVALLCESDAEEKLELGIGVVEEEQEQKSDCSSEETCSCMISKGSNLDVSYEGFDKEGEVEEGEEDVEDLHKRVEAYIHKVRMRFNMEAVA